MSELTDDEKKKVVELALEAIIPIADKYEMNDKNGRMALYEAFQQGVKFAAGNVRKMGEELTDGTE